MIDQKNNENRTMQKVKVAIVGPVIPYRGGIAQHTTMLHRALRKHADCLTVSFTRQYPKILFPGATDVDENLLGNEEPGVEFLIDSVNPLTWKKAVQRLIKYQPSIIIFPWWHVYWVLCFGWMANKLKDYLPGVDLVFLCHNSIDHESAAWKRLLSNKVLSMATRFIVHTKADSKNLQQWFPEKAVSVQFMPVFDNFPDPLGKLLKRKKLELLFFGFVRPYKGLSTLLEAMVQLKDEDVHLTIVGEFWKGAEEAKAFIQKNSLEGQIEIIARYVSDADAAEYFARCDVVVLPYHAATGSAVIPTAYHYSKPVLATKVGGLPDVVVNGETGVLVEPCSSDALAQAIRSILIGEMHFNTASIARFKAKLSWDSFAIAVLEESRV